MKVKHLVDRKMIAKFIGALVSVWAVAVSSPLFLYFHNAGEAHFSDVSMTMLLFAVAGTILFLMHLVLIRDSAKAGFSAILFILLFLNYKPAESLIQQMIPSLRYWHVASILLLVMLQITWLIGERLPADLCEIITPVLGIVFMVLILINGVTAAPSIVTRSHAEREAKRLSAEPVETDNSLPNFYFILFDEFSTIPFMQKHYDYDNYPLLEQLEELGFNISQSGHNESFLTDYVTANLFQMEYKAEFEKTSIGECFALRSNNAVFPLLREKGYQIISPVGAAFYGIRSELSGENKAKTINGETISNILFGKTVFYPFLNKTSNTYQVAKTITDALDYMKDANHFGKGGQFILAHFNLPHSPFYFDADGNIYATAIDDWKNPQYYLDQYRFASDQMLEIAKLLTEQDPDAVIWLLSDHSARGAYDPDLFLKVFTFDDMTNFFNAVYYRGEALDIEGLSGVNTMRLIVNKLLGTSYEMIQMPEVG